MKKGDGILNLAAMVLTAVSVFLLGRFGFSLFGFTFEQPWQFVLFMALFLTLDTVCGELGDMLGVKLVGRRLAGRILAGDAGTRYD